MRLILIGIQGSGKSTQGNLLAKKLKLPYLSSGHIFRKMALEKSSLGRYIKETMAAGLLISDEKTTKVVEEYLKKDAYKAGYILDGYPRTLKQAKSFKADLDKVIYLEVSEKEALWRLSYRSSNGMVREDETLMAVRKRIELFHKKTTKVLDYYSHKRKLLRINGEQTVKQIYQEILSKLHVKK